AAYRAALFAGLAALGLILLLAAAPVRRRRVAAPASDGAPATDGVRAAEGVLAADGVLAAEGVLAADGVLAAGGGRGGKRVMRAGGLCLGVLRGVLLGLWTGGYVGAGLLPAMTLAFLMAMSYHPRSRLARVMAEPWLIAALLAIAAVCGAVGNELFAA